MFSKRRVIKHYAMVLFESSMKNHNMDSIYQNIKKISFLLSKNVELNKFFHSSLLNSERKIQILEKIFYSFDIFLFHFIKILIIRNREPLLKKIFLEYQKIYKEKKGFLKCIITSFIPLSIDIQKMIIHKILSSEESRTQKYHIINKIDKSIIGGFFLRIGYKEWDLSVKKQLLSIQKTFKNLI
ncbi:ATP synthase F1 subunit delta [Blattabacterium sp. (Cryptocercus kyebangensis)]|uniref:ATP synthase F1 subunit delta n=1 Tax=Blattabacterium sp. (Cryptocercus kyebangensis) TaxID=298656 RepID=UPI000D7CCDAB|nr:ATP synthase F1 subunit delta [Blattabacterium sp. (Cryptocercus kyebangensis)]AWU43931.1 ATP synthase F1 subunit delta [Blattabacterium sp. (Cryptocercus kyebangensis)]